MDDDTKSERQLYPHNVHLVDRALAAAVILEDPPIFTVSNGVNFSISFGFIAPDNARAFSASMRKMCDWIDRDAGRWEAIEKALDSLPDPGATP